MLCARGSPAIALTSSCGYSERVNPETARPRNRARMGSPCAPTPEQVTDPVSEVPDWLGLACLEHLQKLR